MNMKKIFFIFIIAILVMVVAVNLLGGNEDGEDLLYNGKTYDACLTELKAANDTLHLLEKYETVSSTMEAEDVEGTVLGQYETRYTRTGEGYLLFSDAAKDGTGKEMSVINGYKGSSCPGANFIVSGDYKYMTIYPSDEYEASIANNSALDWTQFGYVEQAIEVSDSNGLLTIVSILTNESTGEIDKVFYYADAQTLELKERKIETYDEEGEMVSSSQTVYAYDEQEEVAYTAAETILKDGGCELTCVLLLNGEQMEVQKFTVAKDTAVTFQTGRSYKMYSSEELKKKVSSIDVTGETAEVYIALEEK